MTTTPPEALLPTTDPQESRGFPVRRDPRDAGSAGAAATFLSEVAGLGRFHKIGVVEDLATGRTWCLQSDEGASLGGTNLAPAPLFQWLAGIQADVATRIVAAARRRGIALDRLHVGVSQGFASQGSFAKGEAVAHVYGFDWDVDLAGASVDRATADALVDEALAASPAVAVMRDAVEGRFALRTNGRRTPLDGALPEWDDASLEDPVRRYATIPAADPRPFEQVFRFVPGDAPPAGAQERIATHSSTDASNSPVGFTVDARGDVDLATGLLHTSTGLPEMSSDRWVITSDPSGQLAPSPLALVAIGSAFCYHTQLSRYVNVRKLDLRNSGLAQLTTYEPGAPDDLGTGAAHPIRTEMFLNGGEDEAATRSLLQVAANTCYVHRAMGVEVEMTSDVSLLSGAGR
ncbi:MAG: OsmC family protein [Actinomycetales bacterium]|nr:OsmC family protein [Actinomycetales bacterium]